MMGCGSIFLLICSLCSINQVIGQQGPIVRIKNGTLEGSILLSRKGKEFESFRGIPFAQPPVGNLRFEPPQPASAWTGVRSAKEDSNFCIQPNIGPPIGGEDCLYLNVYRPKQPANRKGGRKIKYPVMVWIHGGGLIVGSAHSGFYGPDFLMDHDIILVSMNYRLGSLGFLSTEDLVMPGNAGLKDQAQAIRWVHENIAAFNGDVNSVTIFGESSGGLTVHFHMMNPSIRALFHRAISESGDALTYGDLNRPGTARPNAFQLGKQFNCPTDTSSALVGCLKQKNASEIIAANCAGQVFENCTLRLFKTVIEPRHPGAYIIEEPTDTIRRGDIANIPWLTGINQNEGAVQVAGIYGTADPPLVKVFDEQFMELAPRSLGYDEICPEELIPNVTRAIRKHYLGDKKIDESTRFNVVDMYTDAWFFVGSHNSVKWHLKKLTAPVYYYHFNYKGTISFSTTYGDETRDYGVVHGDELQSLFPVYHLLFPNITISEEDHKMIDVMTMLWVNFAKTGNPTPVPTPLLPFTWSPVRTSNLQYLEIINSTNIHMAENLRQDSVNFWASIPYDAKVPINKPGDC